MENKSHQPPLELNLTHIKPLRVSTIAAMQLFGNSCNATMSKAVALGRELTDLRRAIVSQYVPVNPSSLEAKAGQTAWVNYAKDNIPMSMTQIKRFINLYKYYEVKQCLPLHSSVSSAVAAIGASEEVLSVLQEAENNGEYITRARVENEISKYTRRLKKATKTSYNLTMSVLDGTAPNDLTREQWLTLRDELTDAAENITTIIKSL